MSTAIAPQQLIFSIGQVGLHIGVALTLAFLIATVYRTVHRGAWSSPSFYTTLLTTPVVVTMIMMAICSNVALSFGLVGALSILRFRTAIKDPRDAAYLFLVIAIGLCCGSGAYALAAIGTGICCVITVGSHLLGRVNLTPSEHLLVLIKRELTSDGTLDDADRELDKLIPWRRLCGVADLGERNGCELTYRIRLPRRTTPDQLLGALRRIDRVSQSSLINPNSPVAL